jgi:hypothetical protein
MVVVLYHHNLLIRSNYDFSVDIFFMAQQHRLALGYLVFEISQRHLLGLKGGCFTVNLMVDMVLRDGAPAYFSPSVWKWGTRWCIWLGHCATSRKVAGSIPDGVIGIFH